MRRNAVFKLLPLVPPEFAAATVVTHRTWKVTVLHWDGARAPLTIGVGVEENVRSQEPNLALLLSQAHSF